MRFIDTGNYCLQKLGSGGKQQRGETGNSETEIEVDLEGDVSYATIRHAKKPKREAQVGGGQDAVTYSTVRACSSSAAASDDPNNLYSVVTSTIN
ncbi:hypothetical protein XENORESO_014548 [Xenotaenia resolanae]|uniref:Uncharacterized protein n=1 Tax=Xenotaenia resolanae TaxID=208358 RepID=A0ABV0X0H9_9TELE